MNKILITLFLIIGINAYTQDPLLAKDSIAQHQWVEQKMSQMTIDQKLGQLFMVSVNSVNSQKVISKTLELIERYKVGNLIFMSGDPHEQVKLNNYFQSKSQIPMLVGFDGEWGLDMRLKNTYRFPWNMTLGAIKDNALIEQFGKQLGEHCKRMGIHINFAPVLDINTNPKNPIIGNRSFGESKENVTLKAEAFMKGLQGVGVLANGKHFPGHGDTSQDSHKTLPKVKFSFERINSVELYPYKQLFNKGLASVMVGHLNIPSIDKNIPSSLSKKVVTNILKEQLNYKGLIFTDGMGMAGASKYGKASEVNLKAFLAGNDILLIPSDIPQTIKLFKKSLKNGVLTKQRIDYSVRKILKAKYLVGLNTYKPISEEGLLDDLNRAEDEVLHRKLIRSSLTLLKNEKEIVPIKDLLHTKIAYIKLGDADNTTFVEYLKKYTKVDVINKYNLKALKHYNLVIVGFHKSNATPWKSYKFSKTDLKLLNRIAKQKRLILDVFASPYALLQIKNFKTIESVLVSYQNSKLSQELSAQALFGGFRINGSLPVSIKPNFEVGKGLTTESLNRLQYGMPEEVGMSRDSLNKINLLAQRILKEEMAPSVQILVARHGKVIYNNAFGCQTYKEKRPVKSSHIYDLASLTKILATLPMVMKADEEGILTINSTLGELSNTFKNTNKDTLKLKEILSHYAKLTPWIPFYKRTQDDRGKNLRKYYRTKKSKRFSIQVAKGLYLNKVWKDSIEDIIKTSEQMPTLRYRYSDLGYYILKDILEDKYAKSLDRLVMPFYKSMGMNRTGYLPLKRFNKFDIVPSEKDKYYRHQILRGYVHDMGAGMQGGVGGHAGLFSNANDVAKLMQMYLQGGTYGGVQYFTKEVIDKYNKRYYADVENRRGLGFDKPQINKDEKATCDCVSDKSFGHSGFTGTYTWADPESEIVYVFLSNRTYPTAENKALVHSNIRTEIQKTIQESIIK